MTVPGAGGICPPSTTVGPPVVIGGGTGTLAGGCGGAGTGAWANEADAEPLCETRRQYHTLEYS